MKMINHKLIAITCDRKLKNNRIDGKLDFGPHYTNQLQLVDLQQNSITAMSAIPQITGHEIKIM